MELEKDLNRMENSEAKNKNENIVGKGTEIKSKMNSNFNNNTENKENNCDNKNNTNGNVIEDGSVKHINNNNSNNKNKCKLNIEIVNPKNISTIKILDSNNNTITGKEEETLSRKRIGTFEDGMDLKKQKVEENCHSCENNFSILFNSSLKDPNYPISYTITGPNFKKDGLELVIEDHRNSAIIENMRQRIPMYNHFDIEIQEIIRDIRKELDQTLHNILNDIDISILKKGKDYKENNIIRNFLTSKLNIIEKTISYYHQLKHSLENDLFSINEVKDRLMENYVSRFGCVERDGEFHDVLKKNVICKININRNDKDDSDSIEKQNEPQITYKTMDTTTEIPTTKSETNNNKTHYIYSKNKGKEKEYDPQDNYEQSLKNTTMDDTHSKYHKNKKSLKINIDVENIVDDSDAFQNYIRENLDYLIKSYQTRMNNVNLIPKSYRNPNKMSLDELPLFSSSISLKLTEEFFKNLFPKFEDFFPRLQDIIPRFEDIFPSYQSLSPHSPLLIPPRHRRNRNDSSSAILDDVTNIRYERKDIASTSNTFLNVKNKNDLKAINIPSLGMNAIKERETSNQLSHNIKKENYYYGKVKNTPLTFKKEKELFNSTGSILNIKQEIIEDEPSTSQTLKLTEFTDVASSSRSIHPNEYLIRPPHNSNFEIPINSMFTFSNIMESNEGESKSTTTFNTSTRKFKKHGKNKESGKHESSHGGKKVKKKKKKGKKKEEDSEFIVID
ncbi:hypothetical protein PIROE2DRAFT_3423 [Piromyces sp. E2]|nr:hypothetical protein PIROE2DRAFT_3423 [Piromyces sp. E2]|eukprot:OUM68738.1 hypothetical protein PIROE2DRAFT_3423 [Piromyces sp. E2]